MASTNDVTGDKLITKSTNDNYRDNYDRIFGKKKDPYDARELNSHPEYHVPVRGGLGKTLCGIMSYTLDACTGKPLCKECERIKKEAKNVQKQEASGDSEEVAMSELRDSKRNGCSGA